MTELRQRMIEDLRLRNFSENTVVCYVRAVRQYAQHFGKSPDRLDAGHLRQYLLHLLEVQKVAQGTYNQKVAALRFFYRETLKKPAYVEGLCFTRKERKLPVVLSHNEIRRFLEALDSLKYRAVLMTCYGAGLRIGPIALQNPKVVYGILFRAAWETVRELAKDPKHLGAKVGMLSVLHTWGSNLMHHPHLHCIVPGGGVALDGRRWVAVKRSRKRKAFFLPVRVMSRVFRGKFLQQLKAAYRKGELGFHGELKSLSDPKRFEALLNASAKTDWVVYCKRPFGGPRQVLKYLARYTHRVAIANSRLVSYENGVVRFRWKDYRHGSQTKVMSLRDTEFIRWFLRHVLPAGLVRIRHHGFLANRNRSKNLKQCRELLGVKESPPFLTRWHPVATNRLKPSAPSVSQVRCDRASSARSKVSQHASRCNASPPASTSKTLRRHRMLKNAKQNRRSASLNNDRYAPRSAKRGSSTLGTITGTASPDISRFQSHSTA